jgi:hypothetical protein
MKRLIYPAAAGFFWRRLSLQRVQAECTVAHLFSRPFVSILVRSNETNASGPFRRVWQMALHLEVSFDGRDRNRTAFGSDGVGH